jgi:hypothetical protein
MKVAAGKPRGRPRTSWMSACTPPAEALITTMSRPAIASPAFLPLAAWRDGEASR